MIRFLLAALVAVAHLGCSAQSPLTCVVGQGAWFATYLLKPNQSATGLCTYLGGEGLGIRKYFPSGQRPTVDIGTDALGSMASSIPPDSDPTHSALSAGALSSDSPDSTGFCSITGVTRAEQNAPGREDIAYQWNDVRFLTTANVPGTQMTASLRYTQDNCIAEYKVVAMTPLVDCARVDNTGMPITDPATGDELYPDDSRCSTVFNVNPDFLVHCQAVITGIPGDAQFPQVQVFRCALNNDPPSVK